MIARIGVIRKMNTSVEIKIVAVQAMRWLGVRREAVSLNSSFLP
ncbi:hypothetical protein [Bradyrhizobium sp. USDA 4469]